MFETFCSSCDRISSVALTGVFAGKLRKSQEITNDKLQLVFFIIELRHAVTAEAAKDPLFFCVLERGIACTTNS